MVFDHNYKDYPELTSLQILEFGFSSPHVQYENDFDAIVTKVHDGDTVTLNESQRDFPFPLRLLNVDAKELSKGGYEARDWLRGRILNQTVRIIIDPKQRVGKYGRLLGRIMHGGLDVSEEMLHLGLVKDFDRRYEGDIPDLNKWFKEGGFK